VKGDTGATGTQGVPGPPGLDGVQGLNGVTALWKGTAAQYAALPVKDSTVVYMVT
jgi:hypothetical protein